MVITVILFLILLSILVLAHEWGHYTAARCFGVRVEEFGLGYPPRLFSWISKKTGVRWSVNAIPIGGFVRLEGEDGQGDASIDTHFGKRPIWQRFTVLIAGVFMNMVVAVVFFTVALAIGSTAIIEGYEGSAVIEDRALQITQLLPGSPAQKSGLMVGDGIVAINEQVFSSGEQARAYVAELGEDAVVALRVVRDGQEQEVIVVPSYIRQLDDIGLGLALYETGIVRYPWYTLPIKGVEVTAFYTKEICLGFYEMAASIFQGNGVGTEVSGPVGIAVMTREAAALGLTSILQFGAILSINLAILNSLPIPALDGGRVVFLAVESILRRPIHAKIEAAVHNIGFLLLMALIIFVTYKDVLGLF